MWLVERLPKESSAHSAEVLGAQAIRHPSVRIEMARLMNCFVDTKALLQRNFAREVAQRNDTLWTPSFCKKDGFAWRGEKSARWQLEGAASIVRYNAARTFVPNTSGGAVSSQEKRYYKEHLELLTDQPPVACDVPASVLEAVSTGIVAEQEWDLEWSTKGVKSGLSEKVGSLFIAQSAGFNDLIFVVWVRTTRQRNLKMCARRWRTHCERR